MRLFQYLKQAFDGTVAQLELVGEAAVGEVRTWAEMFYSSIFRRIGKLEIGQMLL